MKTLLISVSMKNADGGIAVWTNHYLSHCGKYGIIPTLVNTEKTAGRLTNEIDRTKRIFNDLTHALNNDTFDLAHLNTSCGRLGLFRDYLIAKKIKKHGIPLIIHYHCDIPMWAHGMLRRWVVKKMARLGDLNLVLCENSRLFMEKLGFDTVKVPNFIDDNVITTKPKEIRSILSRIFFVGRISIDKGAAEVYELAKRFPDKKFALAGLMCPPMHRREKPANIHHMGIISYGKVLSTLDEADLFLFPSHSEGFSMALMEAMARGVPAIAVDSVGANADMLADNCGVTVPLKDVDAMERAIRELEDPDKRKAISANAIEKVRTQYTTDAVLALFKSLYETLV